MIAQAEHIPVHLGAMPDAVAAVRGARPGAGRRAGSSTTRTRAARTCPDITLVSRTARRLRRHARAPRRRRRRRSPAACPRTRGALDGGGRRDPADPARRRRRSTRSSPGCATRTSAAATSAPSSRRTVSPSGASTSSCARRGRERGRARDGRAATTTRSAASAPAIARLPDGRFEATDVARGTPTGELELRVAVTIAGDELELDFAGTAAAARREPQLPARGHAARPATSSSAASPTRTCPPRAAPSPGRRSRRPRARSSTRAPPAAVAAGNVETLEPDRRRRLRRLRPGACPSRRRDRAR